MQIICGWLLVAFLISGAGVAGDVRHQSQAKLIALPPVLAFTVGAPFIACTIFLCTLIGYFLFCNVFLVFLISPAWDNPVERSFLFRLTHNPTLSNLSISMCDIIMGVQCIVVSSSMFGQPQNRIQVLAWTTWRVIDFILMCFWHYSTNISRTVDQFTRKFIVWHYSERYGKE